MKKSSYYYKALTKAEVGNTGTHEIYVRMPNDFDYEGFFNQKAVANGTVLEVKFTAIDITNTEAIEEPIRFVYFANSNKEKRMPGLGSLFAKHNVQEGDIFFMESVLENATTTIYVKFFKYGSMDLQPGQIYFTKIHSDEHITSFNKDNSLPLQKITYGAPGTGKSHGTNEVVRKFKDTVRTTFHPDSDYSTFVGAYKPTTTREKMYGLDSVGQTVQYECDGKPLETIKIEYKFIPQAFIKAYIQAWKKIAQMTVTTHTTSRKPIILTCSGKPHLSWKITEIKGQDIYLESCYKLKIEEFKNSSKELWDKAWESGTYDQAVFTTFQRYQQTVCNWIYQNIENNDFDTGWDKFIAELNNGILKLQVNPYSTRKNKTFYYHIDGDAIIVNATVRTSYDTVSDLFESEENSSSYQKAIANKLKEYSEDIDEAWQKLEEELELGDGSSNTFEVQSQYLVIEEINRGNCAQIFGDLFQLLDRNKAGFSEYPIEADDDVSNYIRSQLENLTFNPAITNYINLQFVDGNKNPLTYDIDGNRVYALEAILNGKILVLPSNLHIWATMNTSDQSLFPIDSAFKRRWDWEYKPIIKPADKNWEIQVGPGYEWWTFLEEVNKIINELTSSEDKKLGYFFAKAKKVGDKDVVDIDTMVNKVFFYLWNDVFKDYDLGHLQSFPKIKEDTSKTDSKERPYSFGDFFDKVKGEINKEAVEDFMKAFMPNTATTAAGTTPQEPTEQTTE